MTQLDLLSPRHLARRRDPKTSRASARNSVEAAAGECLAILEVMANLGHPATSREIGGLLGRDDGRWVAAKRLSVLERGGLVRRVGAVIDPTTGRQAETWSRTV